MPTILRLSFSFRSRFPTSASTDILHSSTLPDVTSIKLSIPNPTREMLPASAPATTATSPSKLFHAIVKYSNCLPRCAMRWRSMVSGYHSWLRGVAEFHLRHPEPHHQQMQPPNPLERTSDRA